MFAWAQFYYEWTATEHSTFQMIKILTYFQASLQSMMSSYNRVQNTRYHSGIQCTSNLAWIDDLSNSNINIKEGKKHLISTSVQKIKKKIENSRNTL